MIYVADGNIKRLDDLSESFVAISKLINNASQWLQWAFSEPARVFDLSVRNEGELLTRMLEGLHGTALVKIDNHDQGLLVHPLKLMELTKGKSGVKPIEAILKAEDGYRDILKDNNLLTRTDLKDGMTFLKGLGVDKSLIFQNITLADQILLVQLHKSLKHRKINDTQSKEAAQFAIDLAQTAGEFGDCFNFYLAVWEKLANTCRTKETRKQKAHKTWRTLTPLSYSLLETFSFSREFIWEKLFTEIKSCLLNGFQPGFISLPKAICHIMAHTPYTNQAGDEAREIITQSMDLVNDTIVKGIHQDIRLSQDGLTRSYTFMQSNIRTILEVDTWGIVTLASSSASVM